MDTELNNAIKLGSDGNLKGIKQLQQFQMYAIESAATHGHLNIVKWAFEEDIVCDILFLWMLTGSIRNKQHKVLIWLLKNPHGFTIPYEYLKKVANEYKNYIAVKILNN